jgi:hypothetical protein
LGSAPPERGNIRPLPPRLATYTVSGQTIIAAPGPISVTVRPLTAEEVLGYFRGRPAKVNPFQGMQETITPFFIRIENRVRDQVTFDPGFAALKDQDNRSRTAWDFADLYQAFGEKPGLLKAAQGGVFAGLLVVPPDQSREGLLIFPAIPKDAKALFLHLGLLYVGPTPFPLIFEFTVVPEESKK